MTDASFTAAGYAVLIEDDPLEKYTSTRKAYAPVAHGSKTFSPAQQICPFTPKSSEYFFYLQGIRAYLMENP